MKPTVPVIGTALALALSTAAPAFADEDSSLTEVDLQPLSHCLLAMQIDGPSDADRGLLLDLQELEWWDIVYIPERAQGTVHAGPEEAISYVTECDELELCDDLTRLHNQPLDADGTVHLVDASQQTLQFALADHASKKDRALMMRLSERVQECSLG